MQLKAELDRYGFIYLVELICFFMLIVPVECVDITFSGNEGPYTYKTNDDISISWHLNYQSRFESYTISVMDRNDKKKIWEDTVLLNDTLDGEHSPIDRSINLGKTAEGVYLAEFYAKPNDDLGPISDYVIFEVAPRTGSIQIVSFYDINANRNKDTGEGHEGIEFKSIGPQGVEYSAVTRSDGIATITVPVGNYAITESPRDCWRPLSGMSQVVNVLEDQTAPVVFMDEPDTLYEIFGYNDSTHNGISGFAFTVSGPDGTQILVSGPDGTAKPSRISMPGIYTVIATPPAGMEIATPAKIEFNPCVQKQIEFGANKTESQFSAITGRMIELGKWIYAHGIEIVSLLIYVMIILIILSLITKYWQIIKKYCQAILGSAIVGYIVSQIEFILNPIWVFLNTSFGFCFTITYGLSLAALEIDPEMTRLIMHQIPDHILSAAMSLTVAAVLATLYNYFNPKKQYHSMAYKSTDTYAYSYLDNLKAKGPGKVLWKWYSPDGKIYETKSLDIDSDTVSCHCSIQIAGKSAANLAGAWHVYIFLDGKKILTERFVLFDK